MVPTISVQAPNQNAKLAGCIKSTYIVTLPVLSRGQPDSGKSCIMLESRVTRTLVAKLSQHSSLAVPAREFRDES